MQFLIPNDKKKQPAESTFNINISMLFNPLKSPQKYLYLQFYPFKSVAGTFPLAIHCIWWIHGFLSFKLQPFLLRSLAL